MDELKEKVIEYKRKFSDLSEDYLDLKYSKKEIKKILEGTEAVKLALIDLLEEVNKIVDKSETKNEELNFIVLQMLATQIDDMNQKIHIFQMYYENRR